MNNNYNTYNYNDYGLTLHAQNSAGIPTYNIYPNNSNPNQENTHNNTNSMPNDYNNSTPNQVGGSFTYSCYNDVNNNYNYSVQCSNNNNCQYSPILCPNNTNNYNNNNTKIGHLTLSRNEIINTNATALPEFCPSNKISCSNYCKNEESDKYKYFTYMMEITAHIFLNLHSVGNLSNLMKESVDKFVILIINIYLFVVDTIMNTNINTNKCFLYNDEKSLLSLTIYINNKQISNLYCKNQCYTMLYHGAFVVIEFEEGDTDGSDGFVDFGVYYEKKELNQYIIITNTNSNLNDNEIRDIISNDLSDEWHGEFKYECNEWIYIFEEIPYFSLINMYGTWNRYQWRYCSFISFQYFINAISGDILYKINFQHNVVVKEAKIGNDGTMGIQTHYTEATTYYTHLVFKYSPNNTCFCF